MKTLPRIGSLVKYHHTSLGSCERQFEVMTALAELEVLCTIAGSD